MSKLTPDQARALLSAAESPDGSPQRQELAGFLGDFEPIAGRNWRDFPLPSVVAQVLWLGGYPNEATAVALRRVTANGGDEAALQVLKYARKSFYDGAMHALHHKRPDFAKTMLDTSVRVFGPMMDVTAERCLLELMEFTNSISRPVPPSVAPTGRATVVNMCVWGDRFIKAAEQIFLPCCLARGNLPALATYGTLYFRVHTSAADVERLRNLPVMRELAQHAQIDIDVIPETLLQGTHITGKQVWTRPIIAALYYADLMWARSIGADFIVGGADFLISNEYYSATKQHLVAGYEAVISNSIRSLRGKLLDALEKAGCRNGQVLNIPADLLYRASFEAAHPFIYDSFMRDPPTHIPMDPVQFYFPTRDGFVMRGAHLSMNGCSTRRVPADLVCDYHTLDTRFLSDLTQGLDRDKACYVETRMPGKIYSVSLDEEEGVADFGPFEMSPAATAQSVMKWVGRYEDFDYFLWALRQRFEFAIPPGVNFTLPAGCRDEESTMAEIVDALKQLRPAVFYALQQFSKPAKP